jgi:hypothetical protein
VRYLGPLSPCADFSAGGLAQVHGNAKKDYKTRAKKQNRPHEAAGSGDVTGATIGAR